MINSLQEMTLNVDAQTLAGILLGLRILAVILIGAVLYRQIVNLKKKRTDYPAVRMAVLVLTATLFVGQFIPILLDAIVTFGSTYPGRTQNPHIIGVSYALNNAVKDVVIGALLCFLYFRPGATRLKR